jgi:hypothetical protein
MITPDDTQSLCLEFSGLDFMEPEIESSRTGDCPDFLVNEDGTVPFDPAYVWALFICQRPCGKFMIQLDELANDVESQLDAIRQEMLSAETEGQERRGCPRFSFPAIQTIAPCDGIQFPARDMFRQVRCHDISQRGISFLWPMAADFQYVIVKLSPMMNPVYLVAEVNRSEPVAGLKDEFLVCCQFLNRVKT